jgi:hypothetical protein
MRKFILISVALAVGTILVHAQGLISLSTTSAEVYSNGVPATGAYIFEVLDMTEGAWAALTPGQQAGAANIFANPTDLSLWTDSGVSGMNMGPLHPGGIEGMGGAGGTTAANWAAPTGTDYDTGGIDYYTIVGWSASGGTWSQIETNLEDGTLSPNILIGQTQVAYNYAGGGSDYLPAVNLFAPSAATGLAGSGGLPAVGALEFDIIPEPSTVALVGLGSLSMLFLRRRKL